MNPRTLFLRETYYIRSRLGWMGVRILMREVLLPELLQECNKKTYTFFIA
jgi:hypothetical protein